ncbi:hypothetical protein BJ322DRAFT_1108587 [Thelephora terrestris]|uniref:Thiaminase-2/PQQC domain-containing protein n=1 Tax=Thelephora terrestris TaxID=56493 RepID=A0A9P6L6S1_9AGAM|nr:hypothetical protein BJ322DRAFT_1108587 [Thelephora terrestris]
MSAPFIHIPKSSPVSGRALDFLGEFNRVAADPELGASIEQLQKAIHTTKPADGAVAKPDANDLVGILISENKEEWDKLLKNKFCYEYMKTKPKDDKPTLKGFEWYMRQDFLYLVKQCQYEADRSLRAKNTTEFKTSMSRVKTRPDNALPVYDACIAKSPDGLGINEYVVLSTPATEALNKYIALLTEVTKDQNWVMVLVAMIPCVQSYYRIAVDLHSNSTHKDTPWYKLWVETNVQWESSTVKQIEFFKTNYTEWKDHYPKAKEIFKKAIQAEIDLWGTALDPPKA